MQDGIERTEKSRWRGFRAFKFGISPNEDLANLTYVTRSFLECQTRIAEGESRPLGEIL